jgi:hypothetical protein
VDGSGNAVHKWPVWRCLVGQFRIDDRTYILDEGEFFEVRTDYLRELDAYVSGIGPSTTTLPASAPGTREDKYNADAAAESEELLLMDKQLVRLGGRTSPVEVCDLRNTDFRSDVQARVDAVAGGRSGFAIFQEPLFASQNFTIVYAIIAPWKGRSPAEAMPFFSKVNLRGFVDDLRSRDFNVALTRIEEKLEERADR